MRNVIDAIMSLVRNPVLDLNVIIGNNRAISTGKGLEEYIKNLFAAGDDRLFSYIGNQNNPPDFMLKGGDAIEVKKIEVRNGKSSGYTASLSLNSSYPKDKLYADSPLLTKYCREAEEWTVKEMLYAIGFVNNSKLNALTFIYGSDYAADKSIYERVRSRIKSGVESISDIELSETNELGHVNRVDPLGITYLRVRGMWGIENPFRVFREYFVPNPDALFTFMMIVNLKKYQSFPNYKKLEMLSKSTPALHIKKISIKSPNNPAVLIPAVLITFEIMGMVGEF